MNSLKELFITSDLYELISIFTYISWNNMNFFLNLQLYNFDWSVYLYYFLYDITLEKTQLQNDWGTTQQIDRYGIHYIVMLNFFEGGEGGVIANRLSFERGYLKNIYSAFGCTTGFEKQPYPYIPSTWELYAFKYSQYNNDTRSYIDSTHK